MLEDLGVEGMSSDEEVKTNEGKKYLILVPKWRAAVLTPWLRVFDALYLYHRNQAEHGDQRGCLPRKRTASDKESTSRNYVRGLPLTAYRADWLGQQFDIANVIHPSAPLRYRHNEQILAYVLVPPIIFPARVSRLIRDWPWTHTVNYSATRINRSACGPLGLDNCLEQTCIPSSFINITKVIYSSTGASRSSILSSSLAFVLVWNWLEISVNSGMTRPPPESGSH